MLPLLSRCHISLPLEDRVVGFKSSNSLILHSVHLHDFLKVAQLLKLANIELFDETLGFSDFNKYFNQKVVSSPFGPIRIENYGRCSELVRFRHSTCSPDF